MHEKVTDEIRCPSQHYYGHFALETNTELKPWYELLVSSHSLGFLLLCRRGTKKPTCVFLQAQVGGALHTKNIYEF